VKDRTSQAITLTADEAAFIRHALTACTGIFSRAARADGPGLRALQEAALEVVADGRPLSQVHYDTCLAVDYIDFAAPAGGTR
jgi:hypothetical protein